MLLAPFKLTGSEFVWHTAKDTLHKTPCRMQIWAQNDLKIQYFESNSNPISAQEIYFYMTKELIRHSPSLFLPCGIWNHMFNKLRRYTVQGSRMATAVQAYSINLVTQGDVGKKLIGISSLLELAKNAIVFNIWNTDVWDFAFASASTVKFEKNMQLFQRIFVMIRAFHRVFHRNI